ncbi:3-hydroxyacyl-CoA dehydrogenase NAD-binding domain-containing protein [Geopsychrobacter electrodiphilus]|uniref:3-hydroxyacyl-CoA dehydrogenase NAD-binding domain-containing protein n=1 Tax=Geopsychrobacter electrodiphilus TaxID=225196 RepID=UPI0003A8B650|nr:3-hydroxyacyl-CoA dehydrogenase NAD-binding domain-containing protein [Geopsychrobacter electrodiphilus]
MNGFRYEKDCDKIVTITMDMPGQPVNTMSDAFHVYLKETIDALEQDDFIGVILTSGKETFFAGGDLKGMLAYTPAQAEERFARSMAMKTRLRRLEAMGKPVVAAINGAALGGGYEICLCTHHRIVMKNPQSLIGLPEVTLGLLPGGGGVVRLTRLLGFAKALPFLLEGTILPPEKALAAGLVDDLAEDRNNLIAKAKAWIKANPEAQQPWDEKGFLIPGGDPTQSNIQYLIAMTSSRLQKKSGGFYPAPETILTTATEAAQVDFESALRIESRNFLELLASPVAQNLITNFFQTKMIKSGTSRPQGFEKFKVKKIGILGAGATGSSIAYAAAKVGVEVVLKDTCLENAKKGKRYSISLLDNQLAKGLTTEAKKTGLLSKITATAEVTDLHGCELLIEAVFEDSELKARVTQETEVFWDERGIFASTSSMPPITGLAETSKDATRFVDLHFISPADNMPLVEVIRDQKTSDETLARAFDFVQQIKKTPIVVNDGRDFYISRVLDTFIDEGCALLLDGVVPLEIDSQAIHAGMPVGPLEILNERGPKLSAKINAAKLTLNDIESSRWIETASERVLRAVTGKHECIDNAHNRGNCGNSENGSNQFWPKLYELFTQSEVQIGADEIQDRLLFRQAIEAVKCLEEGVMYTVAECNVGAILGLGFPAHTGGPLQYINTYGIKKFVARSKELAKKYGDRFEPPELLLEKANDDEYFV